MEGDALAKRRDERLVAVYEDEPPASQAIAGFLIDNGIDATVEGVGGVYVHIGIDRVRVLVFESDVAEAVSLIREAEAAEAAGEGSDVTG
jgi:hypothetical protein